LAPNYSWGHFELAQIYEQKGRAEEAAQESLKADELFGMDSKKVTELREAIAKSGAQGYWKRTLENYKETARSNYAPSVLVAATCVRLNDRECALRWLEKGFEERDDLMINLKVEPVFDRLRVEPRYQELARRVGIP
jgi:hypothetical protein